MGKFRVEIGNLWRFPGDGTWEISPAPLIEFGNMFYVGDIKAANILMAHPVYNTNVAAGVYNVQWLNPGTATATVNRDGSCTYTGMGFVTNPSCQPNATTSDPSQPA